MTQREAFEAWFFDGVADKYRARDNEYDIAFDAWKAGAEAERERIATFVEGPCGDMQLADRNELRAVAAAIREA